MSSSQGGSVGSSVGQIARGYTFDPDSIRDSSDWTKRLKEGIIYQEYTPTTNLSDPVYLVRGNQFRLSYLFGGFKCPTSPACTAGAFNGSVPIPASGLPT
jgi:hypothetical protein